MNRREISSVVFSSKDSYANSLHSKGWKADEDGRDSDGQFSALELRRQRLREAKRRATLESVEYLRKKKRKVELARMRRREQLRTLLEAWEIEKRAQEEALRKKEHFARLKRVAHASLMQEEETFRKAEARILWEKEEAEYLAEQEKVMEQAAMRFRAEEEALRAEEKVLLRKRRQIMRDRRANLEVQLHSRPSEPPLAVTRPNAKKVVEDVSPSREPGYIPPDLKAMIASALLEARSPPPTEHKERFVPLVDDAASLGRLLRLEEKIVEAQGTRDSEKNRKQTDVSYSAWEMQHSQRGRKRMPQNTRTRSDSQIMVAEAAALGKLKSRRYSGTPTYGDDVERYQPQRQEKEIDDLSDEHNARVIRAEYLLDRHVETHRKNKAKDWLPDDAYDAEYHKLDDVALPTEEQPRFKPKQSTKTRQETMETLSRSVAEGYWERMYRLERPGAMLKTTTGCHCKYCHHTPTPYQTFAYQKKWAEGRASQRHPDGESEDNLSPKKCGYLERLYVQKDLSEREEDDIAIIPLKSSDDDADKEKYGLPSHTQVSIDLTLDAIGESDDEFEDSFAMEDSIFEDNSSHESAASSDQAVSQTPKEEVTFQETSSEKVASHSTDPSQQGPSEEAAVQTKEVGSTKDIESQQRSEASSSDKAVSQTPAEEGPFQEAPSFDKTVSQTPAEKCTLQETSSEKAALHSTEAGPSQQAPSEEAAVQTKEAGSTKGIDSQQHSRASSSDTMGSQTPAEEGPFQETASSDMVVSQTPAEENLSQKASSEKAALHSTEDDPSQQAPSEEATAQTKEAGSAKDIESQQRSETASSDMVVSQTPVDEGPFQEATSFDKMVSQTPAEERIFQETSSEKAALHSTQDDPSQQAPSEEAAVQTKEAGSTKDSESQQRSEAASFDMVVSQTQPSSAASSDMVVAEESTEKRKNMSPLKWFESALNNWGNKRKVKKKEEKKRQRQKLKERKRKKGATKSLAQENSKSMAEDQSSVDAIDDLQRSQAEEDPSSNSQQETNNSNGENEPKYTRGVSAVGANNRADDDATLELSEETQEEDLFQKSPEEDISREAPEEEIPHVDEDDDNEEAISKAGEGPSGMNEGGMNAQEQPMSTAATFFVNREDSEEIAFFADREDSEEIVEA
jgi:hypothetical protein